MPKKQRLAGPGRVIDRSARGGKLTIAFDPSPGELVTEARREKGRLVVTILAEGVEPIVVQAAPHVWQLKLVKAAVPDDRLADLEELITEERDVHIVIEYTPAPKLPGLGPEEADDERA